VEAFGADLLLDLGAHFGPHAVRGLLGRFLRLGLACDLPAVEL
jgi:hypothetical protein